MNTNRQCAATKHETLQERCSGNAEYGKYENILRHLGTYGACTIDRARYVQSKCSQWCPIRRLQEGQNRDLCSCVHRHRARLPLFQIPRKTIHVPNNTRCYFRNSKLAIDTAHIPENDMVMTCSRDISLSLMTFATYGIDSLISPM